LAEDIGVTPSFKQGQYIEATISSVPGQGYRNLEYLIMDGGSNDNTVEVIEKYSEHLTYWVSEPDEGQTDALIMGFNRTSGDIFCWLCSDDLFDSEPCMRWSKSSASTLTGRWFTVTASGCREGWIRYRWESRPSRRP
jgi:glycosyl transferase family 2